MAGAQGEAAFYTHPRLYAPLSENIPTVLRTSLDITTIANRHPEDRAKLDVFLQKHGGQVRDYAFLPLRCRYESLTMVLHKPDGKVVGTIDISPPLT